MPIDSTEHSSCPPVVQHVLDTRELHPEGRGAHKQNTPTDNETQRQRASSKQLQQQQQPATQRTARVHGPWSVPTPRATLNEVGLVLLRVMVSCLAHVLECRWSTMLGILEKSVYCVVLCAVCSVCACVRVGEGRAGQEKRGEEKVDINTEKHKKTEQQG